MRNRKNLPTRPVRRPATVGLARPNNKIVLVSAPDPYVFGLQDPHPDPLVISTDIRTLPAPFFLEVLSGLK